MELDKLFNGTKLNNDANYYLGQKGFTIYKNSISNDTLSKIKKDLDIKPYAPPNSLQQPKSFPLYRESVQKIYVPRFYGFKIANITNDEEKQMTLRNDVSDGDDISLEFNGGIRDYQTEIVNEYFERSKKQNNCGLLEIPCGFGKTVMGLYIISILKKKTLIIVHKEFLLNQWIERIEQFLPDAKVGKIQGQTIDIEGKDIVIGMLQSLSMKDYPSKLFNSFGFTIVDECHRIGAEVFCRSLFKIITKKMLGLSATMNRKDGTSKVFKLFLGDVVSKREREDDTPVEVRQLYYKSNDPEFSEVEYNFKGQTHYTAMIKKLCEYNHRTETIIKVISDLIKEGINKQIMILAHNKSILHYLYDAIEHREIGTVGYYIGGMKEHQLKETESKQIVIATYAMAEEALDIKTLDCLIMATPKTDVTQAVGRILRMKHKRALVYDIVDQHEIFIRQSNKRMTFYKKCKYVINKMTSQDYLSGNTTWTNVFDGKTKKINKKTNKKIIDENTIEMPTKTRGKCLLHFGIKEKNYFPSHLEKS